MIKKRLLAVQGPLQFVAGYIAMDWFGKARATAEGYDNVLLMYDFLMPEELEPEFVAVITRLAQVAGWHAVKFIGAARMRQLMAGSYAGSVAALRAELGVPEFDQIFMARDFCGAGSALIGNAYSSAHKVAYGDSLGLVADRTQFGNHDPKAPLRSVLSACKQLARRALFGGPRPFAFDTAVLSLPLDLSHGELAGVALMVPSRQHVRDTVGAIGAVLDELQDYSRSLLAPAGAAVCQLFLLSNLSASGLMSEENEIALYTDIIGSVSGRGDLLFLKVHPRSSRRVLDAVVSRIGVANQVSIIDDAKLARLPVELWSDLIAASNVVAIFSTGALNIKYIHDKDVVLPLTTALIERYVYPDKVAYIAGVHGMIGDAVAALGDWDGQSILWKKYS